MRGARQLEVQKEKMRARRAAARQHGVCDQCFDEPPIEGGARCRGCLDYAAAWQQQHFEKRREAGLCIMCGAAQADGHWRCVPCQDTQRKRHRDWRAARAARGICGRCPKPATPGRTSCEDCRHRRAKGRKS
jgi:hypothetical protein